MNKNVAMLRKVGGLGLAGVLAFGAAQTQAETFNVTSTVQNTLAVTNVQDMNLGTLFAAAANSSQAATLLLSPDGTFGTPPGPIDINGVTSGAPTILSLGGQQAARASVATGEDFTVTLPAGLSSALNTESAYTTTNDPDGIVVVAETSGDPGIARFYLVDFTIGDETADSNPDNTADGNDFTYDFAPGFGVNTVEFGIGATIVSDGSGARTEYAAGTYEGSFEVTASF